MLTIENVNQDIETTLKQDKSRGAMASLVPVVATPVPGDEAREMGHYSTIVLSSNDSYRISLWESTTSTRMRYLVGCRGGDNSKY